MIKRLALILCLYSLNNTSFTISVTPLPDVRKPLRASTGTIPQLPPGMTVMAGYITLHNPNKDNLIITSLSSKLFKRVEIHKTMNKNGMLSMQKQDSFTIAANSTSYFKPGGLHIMLIGPKRPLRLNETINILCKTKWHYKVNLKFIVKSSIGNGDAHKHHHH